MTEDNKKCCGNCNFWVLVSTYRSDVNKGDCHRFPPVLETKEDHWCGEFEPRTYGEERFPEYSKWTEDNS